MRCCDDSEPIEAEASEVGPVSSLGFCSMTVGCEAACGLYIWRIAKHLHIRLAGIQGTMPFLNLQLVLFVHKKLVQTMFHEKKLKCEGVDIYTAFELLMRELTSGLATRQGIWVGELRRGPSQSPASSAKTAWDSGQLSMGTHQRTRSQRISWRPGGNGA